ncbi:unnamed protein product [Linum tenue]|uniref:DUF4378 domain-containing protein n=1 Tax=Linum tenue TaxID=586396 RepID=A0AAV0MXH6_9ROSI|nr:unnamed protein product [Linum tenue]
MGGQGMEQSQTPTTVPVATTTNCLAVSDKRPNRPGGCVGIFFQLFDWNRRFAKKKLFSTKLLPPARTKQASKKFAGDEKMPKTKPRLIEDENSGGFPANAKKISKDRSLAEFQKQEMRSPSLIARLMGLDSMPALQRDKHKKASNSVAYSDARQDQRFNDGSDRVADLNSDKVSTKLESRPQKLQKTGQCDRRAVAATTRFGAEALDIRSVLSRSRKHKYNNPPAKLATPVKSPKLSPARHASRTSRLIDAATRILEPGIQATNRAKSTIAYSNSRRYGPDDDVLGGVFGQSVKEVQKSNVTSCRNCGNAVDVVVESRSHSVEEEPFQYRAASLASHFATEQGRDVACKRKPGQHQSSDVEKQDKGRACSSEVVVDRKAVLHEFRSGGQSNGFQHGSSNHQRDDETCAAVGFKQRSQGQSRMPVVGTDKLTQGSKLSSFSGTKDFVAMNRSLSGRSRARVSNRMDNPTFNMERKFCNRRDDVLPQLRSPGVKRKTVSVKAQLQNSGHGNSSMPPVRQRSINFDAVNGKEIGSNPFRARTRFDSHGEGNNDLASFTFSSPSRVKTGYGSRNQMGTSTPKQRNMVIDESEAKRCVQKQVSPRRDALGSLLEQKLKELISQEEDELKGGSALPIRSTAMILQELISALTIETSIPTSPPSCFPIANTPFQNGKNHLSPGSVLDASFSNESCFSSSLDDNSASSMLNWDSTTTSTTEGRTFSKLATDLHDHISRILQCITLAGGGCELTSRDLGHAKETILTAELLFGAATHHGHDRTRSSVLGSFLLDELNAVAVSMGSTEGSKEASNQLRRLLFDCVIEWLDSRYSRYCDAGFRTWRQQQLVSPWCKETVMEEVEEEVKRWTNMAGLIPDEMVELEMGQSLAKWTEFEVESYEIGGELGCEIVEVLLEETMRDLWQL